MAAYGVGTRKAKQYLWPSEFVALVLSDRVTVPWRGVFALAVLVAHVHARGRAGAALDDVTSISSAAGSRIHRSRDRRGQPNEGHEDERGEADAR